MGKTAKQFSTRALGLLRVVAIAYLSVVLLMTMIEGRLVYPAPPMEWGDWAPPGDDYRDVWIEAPPVGRATSATQVHGWFFERPGAAEAVLYCHGNGEDVSNQPELARLLRDELDASVLVWDPRGYGKSPGRPHEPGVIADGLAAQRWLAEATGRRPADVVLIGRSLGGGVATALAAEQGARALILQSTFTTLPDAAASHYPWLPVQWAMRNRYDSRERIARYVGPVLVSHGTADEVVPFQQGRRLFESAPGSPKQFVELPDQTHNMPQPASYYEVLKRFLAALAVAANR